jgi:hypothetical protein
MEMEFEFLLDNTSVGSAKSNIGFLKSNKKNIIQVLENQFSLLFNTKYLICSTMIELPNRLLGLKKQDSEVPVQIQIPLEFKLEIICEECKEYFKTNSKFYTNDIGLHFHRFLEDFISNLNDFRQDGESDNQIRLILSHQLVNNESLRRNIIDERKIINENFKQSLFTTSNISELAERARHPQAPSQPGFGDLFDHPDLRVLVAVAENPNATRLNDYKKLFRCTNDEVLRAVAEHKFAPMRFSGSYRELFSNECEQVLLAIAKNPGSGGFTEFRKLLKCKYESVQREAAKVTMFRMDLYQDFYEFILRTNSEIQSIALQNLGFVGLTRDKINSLKFLYPVIERKWQEYYTRIDDALRSNNWEKAHQFFIKSKIPLHYSPYSISKNEIITQVTTLYNLTSSMQTNYFENVKELLNDFIREHDEVCSEIDLFQLCFKYRFIILKMIKQHDRAKFTALPVLLWEQDYDFDMKDIDKIKEMFSYLKGYGQIDYKETEEEYYFIRV